MVVKKTFEKVINFTQNSIVAFFCETPKPHGILLSHSKVNATLESSVEQELESYQQKFYGDGQRVAMIENCIEL